MSRKKPRKDPISPEERDQFRNAVGDVTPLVHDRVVHPPVRKRAKPRIPEEPDHAGVATHTTAEQVGTEETLYYLRDSLPHRLIRQMKRGQLAIDARIDLHGMTWAEAGKYLRNCLDHARQGGQRCLLIIHGKGYGSESGPPVLKNMLNQWLRHQPGVLMFCSAQARDGGNGALYLLLQQKK